MCNVLARDLMTAVDDILQFGVKIFKDLDPTWDVHVQRGIFKQAGEPPVLIKVILFCIYTQLSEHFPTLA